MKRTQQYLIPIVSVFFILMALASCRTPTGPKQPPPPSDSCCHGHLTVHVYDASGKPMPGAPVTMTGADGKTYQAKTDANGVATFDGLCPGKYTINSASPTANGGKTESTTVQMGCNDKKETRLVVGSVPPPPPPPPPQDTCCHGHLLIHVVDANGNPVAGELVSMVGSNGKTYQATTDANGNAMFDGLCEGQYKVSLPTANSTQGTSAGVTMGCNDKKEVKLQTASLPPPPPPPNDSCCGGRLVVHVFDANGAPMPNTPVQMTGSDGKTYQGMTGPDGTAVFEHLCPGRYVLHATSTQSAAGSTTTVEAVSELGCNDKRDIKMVIATR